jgi:hypothetical protein
MSRTIERAAGLLLLAVGVLLLFSGQIADFIGDLGISRGIWAWWPILIVALSLFFVIPALFTHRSRRLRAGMVIPGVMLAGVGGALLYTSLSERWSAWAFLWSVIPFSFGIGMYFAGWIADAPAFKWIGFGIALGGAVAYVVFATTFGGETFRLVGAVAIIGLGLALTVGGLAERLSRKSPA